MSFKQSLLRSLARCDRFTNLSGLYGGYGSAIVMYHSVGTTGLWGNVSVERFRRDLDFFTDQFDVVSLRSLLARDGDSATERIALTFDDAYQNFYTEVYPLLQEYDVPATVFVPSGFIDDGHPDLIADRLAITGPISDIILTETQLAELATSDLVTIGNHTRTHPKLDTVSDTEQLRQQIQGAKADLEETFGVEVDYFAYPNGVVTDDAVALLEQSHAAAVSTRHGLLSGTDDPYTLPRIPAHPPRYQLEWELTEFSEVLRRLYYA
jgi:peptidoglycan/xylan/chitin deacetylase (PgdA/CDA1 family)